MITRRNFVRFPAALSGLGLSGMPLIAGAQQVAAAGDHRPGAQPLRSRRAHLSPTGFTDTR